MELIKNIYLFSLLVLCVFLGNAQEIESNSSSEAITKVLNKESVSLQKMGSDDVKSKNNYLVNNNIIKITQIGHSNYADVNIRSSNSFLAINQGGSNNFLEICKNAKQLNQSVVQSGNNNYISDTSSYYGKAIDMDINQEGNNLEFINSGTNSISKDLKISQSGNSGSIYIFNR